VRRLSIPVAFAAIVALSGCGPLVCPAIGYLSTVEITLTDGDVVELECVDGCEGGVGHLEETPPTWTIDVGSRPESITVVGRDAAGAEVLRETVELAWTIADPGNACGSSATADPVTLGG
jgi:hypothetical protein